MKPKYAPLVLNTTFTIINTIGHTTFEPYNFYSSNELNKHFSPIKKYTKEQNLCFDCENDSLCFDRKKLENANVVILILESFGAEYIGYLNPYHKGYTPFLDSLFEKSIVFTNAFANGKRSIDALPAIFASLPDITSEPLIGSQFSNNTYFSLPAMLEKEGYYTSFFHGGANGTMGFDIFCKSSGISNYYGKNEYEGPGDDGNWGIFDEEFLSFMADKITTFPEPFFSSVFTLSSHHPYLIPQKHKDKFEEGTLPIHKSISYADYSLRKFFEKIKNFDWYKNTIFIITADHTSQSTHPYFQTSTGNYRIPIAFFIPSIPNLKGKIPKICQQSDIFPSTMQILGIEQKFISFGNSVFDKHEKHFGLTRYNNSFQLLNNDFMILNDGTDKSSKVLYRYKTDSMLQTNVIKNYPEVYDSLSYKLKGILQDYTYRLKMNQLKDLK